MSSTPIHLEGRHSPARPRHRWTEQPARVCHVKPKAWVQERLLLICHHNGWERLPHDLGAYVIRAVADEANAGASCFRNTLSDWTEARVSALAVELGLWPRKADDVLRPYREAEDALLGREVGEGDE